MAKVKLTFVVPEVLYQELREQMTKDQYGLRGKSKWVAEAVEQLVELESYPELVNLSENMQSYSKVETISVDASVKQLLEEAVVRIRRDYPLLEGVQSCVIRTAIMQRLLRSVA